MLSTDDLKKMAKSKRLLKEENISNYKDPQDFILFCNTLSPQSYGCCIQNRVIEKNSLIKLKSSDQRGDVIENGINKEIKASISQYGKFNAVQIRPHHVDIGTYLLCFFEIDSSENVINHFFDIPKEEIVKVPGFAVAHGSIKDNNSMAEYRLTFDKNSDKVNTAYGKAWSYIQKFKVNKNF